MRTIAASFFFFFVLGLAACTSGDDPTTTDPSTHDPVIHGDVDQGSSHTDALPGRTDVQVEVLEVAA